MEKKSTLTPEEEKKAREAIEKALDGAAHDGTYMVGFHKPGTIIQSPRGKKRKYRVAEDGSLRRA